MEIVCNVFISNVAQRNIDNLGEVVRNISL